MLGRDFFLFEIGFYESKIAMFLETIARYEKEMEGVKGELSMLDAEIEQGILASSHDI
jgi:hypothetical protein